MYANFAGKQVSLDGRSACCAITGGPKAPAAILQPQSPRAADPPPSPAAARGLNNAQIPVAQLQAMPLVTVGPPTPRTAQRTRATRRFETATVTALVLGKIVGNSYRTRLMNDKHLWFRDLAPGGSNALVAVAESTGPQAAAKPAGFRIRMPSCYPYSDPVEYRLTWTGNATPQPRPGCQWQPGAGTCRFDPAKDLVIGLTWPAPGAYSLTVVAVGDDHKRTFAPAPAPAPVSVNVVP